MRPTDLSKRAISDGELGELRVHQLFPRHDPSERAVCYDRAGLPVDATFVPKQLSFGLLGVVDPLVRRHVQLSFKIRVRVFVEPKFEAIDDCLIRLARNVDSIEGRCRAIEHVVEGDESLLIGGLA